ncbi:MAG: hypothetical protein M5U22_08305 [Thermoleophilia bacterium]|nr:hypothetical protein [Thermoleophilia bacterium]
MAAVEGLGSVRVTIVETTEGRILDGSTEPADKDSGPEVRQAEELLDPAGGRARLTVTRSDGAREVTVVNGRERTTLADGPGTMTTGLVSFGRYVALAPRAGLPLPLWAGYAIPPGQGYADLLSTLLGTEGEAPASDLRVDHLEDGGTRLIWKVSLENNTITGTTLLGPEYLPVRVESHGEGVTGSGGDLPEGLRVEFTRSLAYTFEKVASFSDSDFSLERPEQYWRQGVTYELSTDNPRSEHADWGHYWLGAQVGEWRLVRAEHVSWEDNPDLGPGAEPPDEFVSLIYDRPDGTGDNENIQVAIRPLRGRVVEDSRADAERRVASGDWERRAMTLAGAAATVYGVTLDEKPPNRADTIIIFLPDALLQVQLWAPVDPKVVLEALRPVP